MAIRFEDIKDKPKGRGKPPTGRPPDPAPGRPPGPKKGRPRIGEQGATLTASEPWKAAGMSRATWYRRQKEEEKGRSKR